MSKSVKYEQDFEAHVYMTGQVKYHKAGIEVRVEWLPGQSDGTRAEVQHALTEVLASIRDEEDA